MNKLSALMGAKLESICESTATYEDTDNNTTPLKIKGLSLAFDKGSLVIENPYQLAGAPDLDSLIGSRIIDAIAGDIELSLAFDNSAKVSVSLRDEDFSGPEAASFTPLQGDIIVFN
ncbi:hypothetical protein [Spongorhabdus nitratireducens]